MKIDLWIGGVLVAGFVLSALAAPFVAPHDPSEQFLASRLEGPSLDHPLGHDELGRDILSRLLHGARISLIVGIATVAIAGSLGSLLGAVAGYRRGLLDTLVMRMVDLVLAFPGILLAIALVAVLGPALEHVVLALVVVGWTSYARLARGQALKVREEEFVAAAHTAGLGTVRTLVRHVTPALLPVLLVQATLGMAGAILSEAALSFLGLGVQAPTPSWGSMIDGGRSHLLDAPHIALFPGIAIFLTVMGLNLLGDALGDRLAVGAERRE